AVTSADWVAGGAAERCKRVEAQAGGEFCERAGSGGHDGLYNRVECHGMPWHAQGRERRRNGMKRLARVLGVALALVMSPAQAAYPDHPIKVVNGFAAGGGSDILLRTIIPAISENLGQQIIVEYRTGAGGNLAMEGGAKAGAGRST